MIEKMSCDLIILGANSGVAGQIIPELSKFATLHLFSRKPLVNYMIDKRFRVIMYDEDYQILDYCKLNDLERIVLIDFRVVKQDSLMANKKIPDLKNEVEINVLKKFEVCQLFCEHMRKMKWGRFVHFGSKIIMGGLPGTVGYAISKYSQIAISNSINAEYSKYGITSNIIDISYYEIGLFQGLQEKEKEKIKARTITIPSPSSLVAAIKFLIDSPDTMGSTISVAGGAHVG